MVESSKPDNIFLVDELTGTSIPLLTTLFEVNILMGFADIVVHQVYENSTDHPLEIAFMMPHPDYFALNKIELDFTLEDGTAKYVETQVSEREKVEIIFKEGT
jgi:hypothetical protein